MKKLFIFLCAGGLIFSLTSPILAGGIINKQNFSAEYLRTFSRNAATDAADVMVYNPAGVMKMEDGTYVDLGIFHALKDYSNTFSGTESESDEPSTVPGLFGLYKTGKWAGFAAFTIPGGGGKVVYDKGTATTNTLAQALLASPFFSTINNQEVEGESYYYGYTVGAAYAVNDMISLSLGARYIDAMKENKGSVTVSGLAPATTFAIEYEDSADGWGYFLGLNIAPTNELNIGIRFETKTELDFETKVKKDDVGILTDGAKEREDLPGLLGLGIAYTFSPKVTIDASFTYYFETSATLEDIRFKDTGNSYDAAVALTYTFNPKLKGSLGYMYTETDIDPDDMLPEAPELDAQTVCAGLLYEAVPGLNLNFALMHTFYDEATRSDGIVLDKDITGIGFGIQYKFK